jgi:glycogen(starch) synthase
MHVLQISWEYPPHIVGGLGRHVADLAPALTEHDVIVTVLTPQLRGGEAFERHQNLTICRVSVPTLDTDDFPVLSIIPVAILSRQLMRFSLADDLI